MRNRKRENPPTKDPAAREAKTPTGSTCERGGAAAAALRSPPTLDSGGFLKESAGSAAGFRGPRVLVDETMVGFAVKRKELEQVVDGLSDFSLSGPAAKSRRLVSC